MKTRHPLPQEMKPARQRRSWLWLGLAAVVLALAGTHAAYQADMHTIQQRLNAGSRMAATSHGPMEYADLGSGPAVLVLHGAGGGHDQGASMAQAYGGEGFRWIVPSRFGYLRTPLPADASTAAQADALLELLDGLGAPSDPGVRPGAVVLGTLHAAVGQTAATAHARLDVPGAVQL
jgi:hypothetical protein